MPAERLDLALVHRGIVGSRRQARDIVTSGRVEIAGRTVSKPAHMVDVGTDIRVRDASAVTAYASRAGHKLAGALDAFGEVKVEGRRALDAGASTGGFADVLLRRGAAEVVAVDVGHGQLVDSIRTDGRVRALERTNVRWLDPDLLGGAVDLVVADLSFISLRLVLSALARCAAPDADHVLLVKPQFELGRQSVGSSGVVRSPKQRSEAVQGVVAAAHSLGLGLRGVTASTPAGVSGNLESFVWLRAGAAPGGIVGDVMDEGMPGEGADRAIRAVTRAGRDVARRGRGASL